MAVYVDDQYKSRTGIYGRMKMSHMLADSPQELHAMARRVGIAREHYHRGHYNCSINKRKEAVVFGAVEITQRQAASLRALQKFGVPVPDLAQVVKQYQRYRRSLRQVSRTQTPQRRHTMKKSLSYAVAAALAFLAFAPKADAGDGDYRAKVTGCYLGASIGYSVATHDTTLDTPLAPIGLNINSMSSEGVGGGGIAGCDYRVPGTALFIGGFGMYDFKTNEHTSTVSIGTDHAEAKFGLENAWTIGGRAGVIVGETALIYGMAGYTQAKLSDLSVSAGGVDGNGDPVSYGGAKFSLGDAQGIMVGGGIEAILGYGWSIDASYSYVMYDAIKAELIPGMLDYKADLNEHVGKVTLKYKIGM